jgi:hypothetical protein
MKLAHVMEASHIHIDCSIGQQIDDNTSKMERQIDRWKVKDMLDQNRTLLRNSIREATESITPYDVYDMKAVLHTIAKLSAR